MSDNGGGEYAGDMGAVMRLADGLRTLPTSEEKLREIQAKARGAEATNVMPVEIRREAFQFALECCPDDSLCQNIQNADLIARWLHAGSVPQV